MVKPTYNLPDSEPDDLVASRHWLAGLTDHYSEAESRRIIDACTLMIHCRGGHVLETGES